MSTPALAQNVKGKGRHYRHPVTEELLPSVTNVLQALSKPALPRWAARTVAEQAWTLRESIAKLERDEAVDLLKGAPWRSSTRAASRGTNVHTLIEAMQIAEQWEDVHVDEVTAPYAVQVEKFLTTHDVQTHFTEVTLFGDGYAGTCDFVGTIDGKYVFADWKTGKDLYPEVALQLSALKHARLRVSDDEAHTLDTIPFPDALVAVLFTEKGFKVREVADCYGTFRSLLDVWHWQNSGSPLSEWQP